MKQTLDEESVNGLVAYRIQRSKETMFEAKLMMDEGFLNGANQQIVLCLLLHGNCFIN
jgi:hypothetical protein